MHGRHTAGTALLTPQAEQQRCQQRAAPLPLHVIPRRGRWGRQLDDCLGLGQGEAKMRGRRAREFDQHICKHRLAFILPKQSAKLVAVER